MSKGWLEGPEDTSGFQTKKEPGEGGLCPWGVLPEGTMVPPVPRSAPSVQRSAAYAGCLLN